MRHAVLVTGAFGNIGRRTVHHLLNAGHRVVAVDLKTPKTEAIAASFGDALEVAWGNICDSTLWPRVLTDIDSVVHLAAIIPPLAYRNPALATAVNQTATIALLKSMEESPTAKRLVFASSMVVAGHEQESRVPPLTVKEAPRPSDLYGETKAECERHITASTLHWSILRIAVCPPSEVTLQDVASFDIMFESSATGRVEVVHNDDAALAFANAVDCDEAVGKILFIGGGKTCRSTALEFFNQTLTAMGMRPLKPESLRPGAPFFFGDWLDTEESQRLLKFQKRSLGDIVSEMKDRAGFRRVLLKIISPVVSPMLERRSPHLSQARR